MVASPLVGGVRATEASAVAPSTAAQSAVVPSQNTGALIAAPGPNPSYAQNAAGEYNFNGNSGFSNEATGFFPTLQQAEAAWAAEYGGAQPSTGLAAVADQTPTGTTGLPVTSVVPGTVSSPAQATGTFTPTLVPIGTGTSIVSAQQDGSTSSSSTSGAANQTGIVTPSDAAAAALTAGLSGASDGVPGSGSIAGMVPVATSTDTTTASGPNTALIALVVVAVLAIVGYFLWKKYGHKRGAAA